MGYYWSIRHLQDLVKHDPVYKDMELKDPWPEIVRLAVKLDGYPRNMSVHCGGVVIVPGPDRPIRAGRARAQGRADHSVGEGPGRGCGAGEDRSARESARWP